MPSNTAVVTERIFNSLLMVVNKALMNLQNLALESVRLVLFRRLERKLGEEKENILVLKTGGLGDFLFGVPAFNLLRNARPDDRLVLLTQIAFGGIHLKNLRLKGLLQIPWVELVEEIFDTVHVIGDFSVDNISRLRRALKTAV